MSISTTITVSKGNGHEEDLAGYAMDVASRVGVECDAETMEEPNWGVIIHIYGESGDAVLAAAASTMGEARRLGLEPVQTPGK